MKDVSQGWFWRMRRGEEPEPPIAAVLGQRFESVDLERGELVATFEAVPAFANPAGQVQGGMLGAMLDALTASVVDATLPPGEAVASLNLNIAFLRPARIGSLRGVARLKRRGRSVAHAEAELRQGDDVVASATAVCMLVKT
jgi:uncharacterized protein (TIGR00369 family)